jgi:tripartite-type tricarboxylate transporter receptor subunit TctC
LYKTLPYDPVREFVGIWSVMSAGLVVVVNPKVPATNLAELLAYAKANPGKLAYASSGVGTTQHLAAELFKTRTGADLLHVPYKGGAPASADLMAGHVQVMFDALSNVRQAVLDGRLRARAVLRGKRARALLDDFGNAISKFIKVMPRDYAKALQQLEADRLDAASVAAE